MGVVCLCRLGSDRRLTSFRAILCLLNLRLAKVQASSRFGDVIIPWNNCQPKARKRDFGGPIERCVPIGLSKSNASSIGDRTTLALFYVTFWCPSRSHWTSMAMLKILPFDIQLSRIDESIRGSICFYGRARDGQSET
jgi:hypothetical protein